MRTRVNITDLQETDISGMTDNDLFLKSTLLTGSTLSNAFQSNSFLEKDYIKMFFGTNRSISGLWSFDSAVPPIQDIRFNTNDIIQNVLLSNDNLNDCIELSGGYYSNLSDKPTKQESSLDVSQYSIANLDYVNRLAANIYALLIERTKSIGHVKPSFIGQIIHSSTLSSVTAVREIYGSHTSWIQHFGYSLRGAENGVKSNSATSDGGSNELRDVPLIKHSHTITHKHNISTNTSSSSSVGSCITSLTVSTGSSSVGSTHSVRWSPNYNKANTNETSITSGNATIQLKSYGTASAKVDIVQAYKNVYIWERVK